jgi:hypothetical protein
LTSAVRPCPAFGEAVAGIAAPGSLLAGATSGVKEAVTIAGRCGMAATVGGSSRTVAACGTGVAGATTGTAGALSAAAVGAEGAAVVVAAGVAVPVISRTTCVARSASRRLRSSATMSVAVCLWAFFAAACLAWGFGFAWAAAGSTSDDWANTR